MYATFLKDSNFDGCGHEFIADRMPRATYGKIKFIIFLLCPQYFISTTKCNIFPGVTRVKVKKMTYHIIIIIIMFSLFREQHFVLLVHLCDRPYMLTPSKVKNVSISNISCVILHMNKGLYFQTSQLHGK